MLKKLLNKAMRRERSMSVDMELIELSDEEVNSVTATGILETGFERQYAADLRYQGVKEIIKKIHMA